MKIYYQIKNAVKANKRLNPLFRRCKYIKNRIVHAKQFRALQKDGTRVIAFIQETLGGREHFFFDAGTLLGIIREGRLLKHDDDIDVAVYAETEEDVRRVQRLFLEAGCIKHHRYEIDGSGIVEDAFSVYGFRFDVFYCKHDGPKDFYYAMYHGPELAGDKERMNVVKLCFTPIRETKLIPFAGIMINVPADPELYLSEKYGENWRVPDKYFKFWDAPNAVKTTLIGRRVT